MGRNISFAMGRSIQLHNGKEYSALHWDGIFSFTMGRNISFAMKRNISFAIGRNISFAIGRNIQIYNEKEY